MIPSERFLVSRAADLNGWLDYRLKGVSATTVAYAATPAGFDRVAGHWGEHYSIDNDYTRFGNDSENGILGCLTQWVEPNDWLIAGENKYHFATPDGLNREHTIIAEVKTTGNPWDGVAEGVRKLPIQYRRQVQWQLHCTGAEKCLVAWMLRVPDGAGWYRFGWEEPRMLWVERDDEMLNGLIKVATRLEEELLAEWDEANLPW